MCVVGRASHDGCVYFDDDRKRKQNWTGNTTRLTQNILCLAMSCSGDSDLVLCIGLPHLLASKPSVPLDIESGISCWRTWRQPDLSYSGFRQSLKRCLLGQWDPSAVWILFNFALQFLLPTNWHLSQEKINHVCFLFQPVCEAHYQPSYP